MTAILVEKLENIEKFVIIRKIVQIPALHRYQNVKLLTIQYLLGKEGLHYIMSISLSAP